MYKFQGLLSRDNEGNITGPMSPILLIKGVAKELGFRLSGLIRVDNNQCYNSGYDHLITKTKYKNCNVYRIFVDQGTGTLPVALFVDKDDEPIMTPIYLKEIKRMEYHRDQVELPKRNKENPIMVLSKEDVMKMCLEAEKSEEFKVKYNDN